MCKAGDDAEILQGANSAAMCPPVTILSRFVKSQDFAPHLQAFSSHVSHSLIACGSMSHHFVPMAGLHISRWDRSIKHNTGHTARCWTDLFWNKGAQDPIGILLESYWHVLDHIGSIFAHSVSFWHFGPWDLELPLSVRMLWRKWFSQQLKGAQDFCFTSQCHSWI